MFVDTAFLSRKDILFEHYDNNTYCVFIEKEKGYMICVDKTQFLC